MSDWIEDQLIQAENWVYAGHDIPEDHSHWSILGMGDFPPLSEIIRDVRYIYDIAAGHYPDPDALRAMSHVLNDCHEKITRLCQEYEQSLTSLSQNWTGHQSLAYYSPPSFNADEISASSPAEILLLNMQTFEDAFQHNAQTFDLFAQKFDEIRLIQAGLLICAGAAVGSIIALIAFPPDAEITVPTLTISVGGGVTSAGTIITLTPMLTLVIGTTAVSVQAVAGTVLILSLIGIALLAIPALQLAIAVPYPSDWTLPDGSTLPKEFEDLAKKIWDQFAAWLKSKHLSDALIATMIAYLACHYTYETIVELFSYWDQMQDLLKQFSTSTEKGKFLEMVGVLNAIIRVGGPANVVFPLGQKFQWVNPDGSPMTKNGKPVRGDIDILTKDGRYIEVGTIQKGSSAGFSMQLAQLKRYAESQGGTAYFYLQLPAGVPPQALSENQLQDLNNALRLAQNALDGTDIPPDTEEWHTIDPVTGQLIPPLPPGSHIVVMTNPC